MNLSVEYKDAHGNVYNRTFNMSMLAFAKHFGMAGQGYAPKPAKLIRVLSMFLHYSAYLQKKDFYNDRFSLPPIPLSDPTEKGQFSNLAGKAIADFLSKQIDFSIFTVNYEAAMRMKGMLLNTGRPDLIAFQQNSTSKDSMFAIEAKGFSTNSSGDMDKHKIQSQTGGIGVNFTIACVSYGLYDKVKCKYHDPYNDNVEYDYNMLKKLSTDYYTGLSGFLDRKYFDYKEFDFQNERFYEITLPHRYFEEMFDKSFYDVVWLRDFFRIYAPSLIIPHSIKTLAKEGLSRELTPFLFQEKETSDNLYIDNDRVGIKINNQRTIDTSLTFLGLGF